MSNLFYLLLGKYEYICVNFCCYVIYCKFRYFIYLLKEGFSNYSFYCKVLYKVLKSCIYV